MTLEKRKLMTITLIAMSILLVFIVVPVQPIAADDEDDDDDKEKKKNGDDHTIEMEAVKMPDGLFAYRMASHEINGADITSERYGENPKPSIPGPTIIINEGDKVTLTLTNLIPCEDFPDLVNGMRQTPAVSYVGVHVHGIHYDITSDGTPIAINKQTNQGAPCDDGDDSTIPITYTYEWDAGKGTAGTWPYHDHTIFKEQGGEDKGLIGTLIINEKKIHNVLLDGKFKSLRTSQIDKEFVLWMVSDETLGRNMFYGMEIDHNNNGKQTPLWVNPVLVAEEGDITRWHIIGLGDEFHSFHLHAHRWNEQGTQNVIDTREIAPIERHTFIIRAGEEVGPGDWNYHCHVFAHMQQGMASVFRVLPEGTDDTLPEIGAVITLSDEPGLWMKTLDAGIVDALDPRPGIGFPLDFLSGYEDSEQRSTAVIAPGQSVLFNMKDSETRHTITSLIFPAGASRGDADFPFDRMLTVRGSTYITDSQNVPVPLEDPGLYVFVCKIHPYMFGAVIVDDDAALPLELGEELTILTRTTDGSGNDVFPTTVPPTDPLALGLVTTFYAIVDPNNWKDYTQETWQIKAPPVPISIGGDDLGGVLLSDVANGPLVEDIPDQLHDPDTPGVGEVLINTQFERTMKKNDLGTENDKPGTVTFVNASDWSIDRKFGIPDINMNHPHNMWSDARQDVIYQTQWFDKRMVTFDRLTGEIVKDIQVGESPSHIMTTPGNDFIYIAMNGEEHVLEVDPTTLETRRQISTGVDSHPHGHWISADGRYIVTPNFFSGDASIIDLDASPVEITNVATGQAPLPAPIATGMLPDSSAFYTADFLGNTFTKIDTATGTVLKTIDILPNGTGIPIQTPISPDGKFMVTAHVLFSKITVLNTETDKIVAVLPCDPGCHGVNFGAKLDVDEDNEAGYYAYVSNKFSNALIVVDPDPGEDTNNDGEIKSDGSDAKIAGIVSLVKEASTVLDDRIIDYAGMGGQGVLTVPNVYNGWIQQQDTICSAEPDSCDDDINLYLSQLTDDQRDPEQ